MSFYHLAKTLDLHTSDPDVGKRIADIDAKKSLAKDPSTTSAKLHELSSDPDTEVRVSVAEHPNTHPDTLDKLGVNPPPIVRDSLIRNKKTRQHTLHNCAAKIGDDIVGQNLLLDHPNIHPDTLHKLADSEYRSIRHGVAKHPKTEHRTHEKLANDQFPEIAKAARSKLSKTLRVMKKVGQLLGK